MSLLFVRCQRTGAGREGIEPSPAGLGGSPAPGARPIRGCSGKRKAGDHSGHPASRASIRCPDQRRKRSGAPSWTDAHPHERERVRRWAKATAATASTGVRVFIVCAAPTSIAGEVGTPVIARSQDGGLRRDSS